MKDALSRRLKPLAVAVSALTAALLGAGTLAALPAMAATDTVNVNWTNTSVWNTGFQSAVTVENKSTAALKNWQIQFTYGNTVASIWDATQAAAPGGFIAKAPSYATTIAAGGKGSFGLVGTKVGTADLIPTGCVVLGLPAGSNPVNCTINGVGAPVTVPPTTAPPTTAPPTTAPPTTPPTTPPVSGDKGVAVTWTNTSEWTAGFQSAVSIKNNSTVNLTPWQIQFTYPDTIVSLWDAVLQPAVDNGFKVKAAPYAQSLPAGGTTTFGLTSNKVAGAGQFPTACTVVNPPAGSPALTCSVNNGATTPPTTTPGDPGTGTTDPGTGATDPGTGSTNPPTDPIDPPKAGDLFVAPYVDMGLWPTADLPTVAAKTGVNALTASFIVADRNSACSPTWAGYTAYTIGGSQDFIGTVNAFQAKGGRVIASFGGAVNNEISRVCTDPAKVLAAYTKVVTRFNLDRVDFDIEGADVSDSASNQRRAAAIATLQAQRAAAGHPLEVTLTLPVLPTGLLANGLRTIKEFNTAGVKLAAVNIMAMDYGLNTKDMGTAAINAAKSTATQLGTLPAYAGFTAAQRTALVGVTPLIGVQDTAGETFTLADATTVATWAKANGVASLGWWETTRDQPCAAGIGAYMCTGVATSQWAYAKAFMAAVK